MPKILNEVKAAEWNKQLRGGSTSLIDAANFFFSLAHTQTKLPYPEEEFKFHHARKWRLDYAYPKDKIGIEIEGGIWKRGRHVRGHGFTNDCRKYNAAARLGWKVFRFTSDMIQAGEFYTFLSEIHSLIQNTLSNEL